MTNRLQELLDEARKNVPTSQEKGIVWHYTFDKPADGWQKPSFDDTACLHARPSCAVAQRSWRVVVFVTGPHS